ncbi:MAG TPA: efflux RND transporter permease subunit, partial [Bacteroidia bacterium]|nr:efflux RND transporter permease subunit [Bacteroidia bacterium]
SLTPMLNAKLIRKNEKKSKFYLRTEPFFVNLVESYKSALSKFMLRRQWAWVIMVGSIAMLIGLWFIIPNELAPLDDRNWLRVAVTAPEGASYEYMDNFMDKLTALVVDSVKEKTQCLSVTAPNFSGSGSVNTGMMRIVLSDADKRKRSQQQISSFLSKYTKDYPEAKTFIIQEQTISVGGGAKNSLPVQFVIEAPNFEKLKQVLPKFLDEAYKDKTFGGIVDVNLKFNKPELDVRINREKAKDLGVSVQDIAQTLQLAYSGDRFAYFNRNGKQYQVIGQMDRANRDEPMDLKSLYVRNANGDLIQLDNVTTVNEESSPPQLFHFNRYMAATIGAGLAPGKTIGDGIDAMNKIAKKTLDDSFSTELTGSSRDFAESSSNILFSLALAIVLIYLVLAAQFESFIDPFIILFTVPLAFAGAFLSLWYFNQTLNIFSEIGMIMLVGLVTKNGILIVEFANQLREKGLSKMDAIIEASTARLRPILMTSLATALGALPIALALGAGAKSRMSMGTVVIGGLLFSLALTLFVIPAIYSFFSRDKKHEDA